MSYINWTGRVLLIDDSEQVIDVFREILILHGMHVVVARTLRHGVAILQSGGIDCVILDLTLPDVTMWDAEHGLSIAAVRNATKREPLPLVVVTGHGSIPPSIGPEAAQEWLLKPVHPLEKVVWAVRTAVGYFHGALDALAETRKSLTEHAEEVYSDPEVAPIEVEGASRPVSSSSHARPVIGSHDVTTLTP